ncbi:MAG: hypothetical protein AB8G22_08900, partial [Saprospiraceae bacterium]
MLQFQPNMQSSLRYLLFTGLLLLSFFSTTTLSAQCEDTNGGTLTFGSGNFEETIFVDGEADVLSFQTDAEVLPNQYVYIITDANDIILNVADGTGVDFDPAGIGNCRIYGLAYTNNTFIFPGFALDQIPLASGCFELSSNYLVVRRISPQQVSNNVFVSSNTQAKVAKVDILADGNLMQTSFDVAAEDADGIFYDNSSDVLYQLNRTDNVIDIYSNASTMPTLVASSTSDFSNGREISVSGNKLIVAQDANDGNDNQNRLIIYDITTTSITLDRIFDVEINLWGIQANSNQLIAIVDNSSEVAVFNNIFNREAGDLVPNQVVTIENMIRTHGLNYDAAEDVLYLTDVGAASSPNDGALVSVENWMTASMDGMVTAAEQGRAEGAASLLGNPVDIAIDRVNRTVFVAERANGGGRILGFKMPIITGGIAPFYQRVWAGASAVHIPGTEVPLDICGFIEGGRVTLED